MEKKPKDFKTALENVDGWGDDESPNIIDSSNIESREISPVSEGKIFAEQLVFLRRQIKVSRKVLKSLRQSLDDQLQEFEDPTLIPEVHAQEEYHINLSGQLDILYGKRPLDILRNRRAKLLSLAERYEVLGREMDESATTKRWDLYYPLGAAYCQSAATRYFSCAETSKDNAEFVLEEMAQFGGKTYTK